MSGSFFWLEVIVFALAVYQLYASLATLRLYRSRATRCAWVSLRLGWHGPKRYQLIAGGFLTAAGCANAVSPGLLPPFAPWTWIVGGLILISAASLPPGALVLAASWSDTPSLIWEVQLAASPLRVVHFLDTFLGDEVPRRDLHEALHETSLRPSSSAGWHRIVEEVVQMVPLVVIDTRLDTPSVVDETALLLRDRLVHKVIFIVDSNGRSPSLDAAAGGHRPHAARLVTRWEIYGAVRQTLKWLRRTSGWHPPKGMEI